MREQRIEEFTTVFKALSDKTRVKILKLLGRSNLALCVCEIMDSIGESHYNVSRHLKILEYASLIHGEKKGRWVFYSLARPANRFRKLALQTVMVIPEEYLFFEDLRLKKRLSLRKDGKCVIGVNSRKWHSIMKQLAKKRSRGHVQKTT